jgi:hypothetical protein
MANTLATLKFIQAVQPSTRTAVSPTERRRAALIARIDEQVALANAQLEGRKPEFSRTVKNKETGEKTSKAKTVKPWYFPQGAKYLLFIRYGLQTLQFAKGTNAIECTSLKAVVTTFAMVRSAVAAGELDQAIAQIASKRTPKSK